MNNKKPNQLDEQIKGLADRFSKIPNFSKNMEDPDLKKIQTFIAVKITSLYATRDLLLKSFLPKVNEQIVQTTNDIRRSSYKHILDTIDYDVYELRYETIRLGYVMIFHKYEVFIKELHIILDQITNETEPLEQYCERKLQFNARNWHKFPSVHIVNFISNCTKHQDGFCKLDNDKHNKPKAFESVQDNCKIIRTAQEFKEDVNNLIFSIGELLVKIIANAYLLRAMESRLNSTYEWNGEQLPLYDIETKGKFQEQADQMEYTIRGLINTYKGQI